MSEQTYKSGEITENLVSIIQIIEKDTLAFVE